ncbi:MAG: zinc-dependent metalloprotease [Bacteroidota bacterium]
MKRTVVLLFLLSASIVLTAQRPYRSYQTQAFQKQLLAENPELKQLIREAERRITAFRAVDMTTEKTIPIIFHIIHQSSQMPIGTDQIQSQIDALNRDFSLIEESDAEVMKRSGFDELRADDTQIRFCLAANQGIQYTPTNQTNFGVDEQLPTISPSIEPQHYLNIWIADLADTVSGYALYPGRARANDGIIIDVDYFGTINRQAPYNEGKTLTHLVGNYLGLYDLWSESGCQDDYIADTPIHNAPNHKCPSYRHVSICPQEDRAEMYMNFMDNTDDACLSMFTHQQVRRMRAVLSTIRKDLGQEPSECSNTMNDLAIEVRNTSDESIRPTYHLELYPNPSKAQFHIAIKGASNQQALLHIYDANGRLLWQQTVLSETQTLIDGSNWQNGIYIARTTIDGQVLSHRFTILR